MKPENAIDEFEKDYREKMIKQKEDYDKMKEKYANLQTLDGLKAIIGEDSWVLVRKSNTENIIRVSAESNSLEMARDIHLEIKELVKQSYEKIK